MSRLLIKSLSHIDHLKAAQEAVKNARNILQQPNQRGLLVPKTYPTLWLMHQLSKPLESTDYQAHNVNGVWRKARVSGRNQARVRKVAVLCGLDPIKDVGLPAKAGMIGFQDNQVAKTTVQGSYPQGKGTQKRHDRYKKIQASLVPVVKRKIVKQPKHKRPKVSKNKQKLIAKIRAKRDERVAKHIAAQKEKAGKKEQP